MLLGFSGDFLEDWVEDRVAGRGVVEQDERVWVGVEAGHERELGDGGAGEGAVQGPAGDLVEEAALLVEQHEDEVFGEAEGSLVVAVSAVAVVIGTSRRNSLGRGCSILHTPA